MSMPIRPEFQVHLLNEEGKAKALQLAEAFSDLMDRVEALGLGGDGRALALAKTKLEEACFFAKRAMASRAVNQE
jgi:hypothetical protein